MSRGRAPQLSGGTGSGISGDASDKDEFCAIEAIRAAGLTPEPPAAAANWQGAGL